MLVDLFFDIFFLPKWLYELPGEDYAEKKVSVGLTSLILSMLGL